MWYRIRHYFREVRMEIDFARYERQQREAHQKLAQSRFSTQRLALERFQLLDVIQAKANVEFGMLAEKDKMRRFEQEAEEIRCLLSFFLRDYKKEVGGLLTERDRLFLEKKALFEELAVAGKLMSRAFDDKHEAYGKLDLHKDRIDSWFKKSDRTPFLLGNAGKKLPKHSIFGQSLGDLKSDKRRRDSAYLDVQEAKGRIEKLKKKQSDLHRAMDCVKKEIGVVSAQINQVKKDQSTTYKLKRSGHQEAALKDSLRQLRLQISALSDEIRVGMERKRRVIEEEMRSQKLVSLEAEIKDIEERKELFLNSFDFDESKRRRKQVHREIWLKQRGLA